MAQDAPDEWSSHAYGHAIDVNPLLNAFHDPKAGWWPPTAGGNVDRDEAAGKISPGSPVFATYAQHGWAWGGFEAVDTDYTHFIKVAYGSDAAYPDRALCGHGAGVPTEGIGRGTAEEAPFS